MKNIFTSPASQVNIHPLHLHSSTKVFAAAMVLLFAVSTGNAWGQQTIRTIAGNTVAGYSGDGSAATSAEFHTPYGVAVDASGNVYIADFGNSVIRKVNTSGVISTFAGTGSAGYSGDGGLATAAQLNQPFGIAVDGSGNVYIADYSNQVIRKIINDTIYTIAGNNALGGGYSGDSALATSAQLYYPTGVAVDGSGNVFIADLSNNVIREVVAATGKIYTKAGNNTAGYSGDGGVATSAKLNSPYGVAVDAGGNLFIADYTNNRIRIVNSGDTINTFAGTGTSGLSGDGAAATSAELSGPTGVAVDAFGDVFIADFLNSVIRIVNSGTINTWAGNDTAGYSGDGGAAVLAELNGPFGIAVSNSDRQYIADTRNNVIRELSPTNGIFYSGGALQSVTYCENSGANSLDSVLQITDTTSGEIVSWSAYSAPAHGTLAVTYSVASTGGIITPSGLTYTPSTGYTGLDSFKTQVTNGSVVAYKFIYVTISTPPSFTLSAASDTICSSASDLLSISGLGTAGIDTMLKQSFNTSLSPWTVDNSGSSGVFGGTGWKDVPAGYTNEFGSYYSPDSSSFALVNADTSGTGSVTKSKLISPYFSTVGYSDATLYFSQYYENYTDSSASVDISTDSGATWVTLVNYATTTAASSSIGTLTAFVPELVSLSAYTGYSNVELRFNYNSPYGYSWAIDNVAVVGSNDATWSPVTNLFSNAGLTVAYSTGAYDDSVYVYAPTVSSSTAFTYYATAVAAGCAVTDSITITVMPAAVAPITGNSMVCHGAHDTLSDATSGGTWSAANGHAVVSSTGVVTGYSDGVDTISYAITGSCGTAVFVVTVHATPSAGTITGSAGLCTGATATLTESVSGGMWTATNGRAVIDSAGQISGEHAGADTIIYTVTNAFCSATAKKNIVVRATPGTGVITGASAVCIGTPDTLRADSSGGVWHLTNTHASISSAGVVTGSHTGPDTAYYVKTASSCHDTARFALTVDTTVYAGAITGLSSVCVGGSITLMDTTASAAGVWSQSNANAMVSSTGVVTGLMAGIDTISYTVTGGCGTAVATSVITVSGATAGSISGLSAVCQADSITLTDTVSGGVWSVSNGNAAITSAGVVTGITPGTDSVFYTLSGSCGTSVAATLITINTGSSAGVISGASTVCQGNNITLTDTTSGGLWSVSNGNATITGGVVTGVAAGTDTVLYTVTNSCGSDTAVKTITISDVPSAGAITGTMPVCPGNTVALADTASGGVWTSNNTAVATVSSSGVVTGISAGTVIINYAVSNSCGSANDSVSVTVNPLPHPGMISGTDSVCAGSSTTLTDTSAGGSWTSSDNTIATIDMASGIITGIIAGNVTVVYALTNGCGTNDTSVSFKVNALPGAGTVTGAHNVCIGAVTDLTDTAMGGIWSSSDTAVATVSAGGAVTGVAGGSAMISYMVTNSCGTAVAITTVTVNPVPSVGTITGTDTICAGSNTTLSDTAGGGVWSSTDPAVATVGAATGIVTGISTGMAIISYSKTLGACVAVATADITVNAIPAIDSITGPLSVCIGSAITLSDAAAGGTWSSSSTSIATVTKVTGVVTGLNAGSTLITYTALNGCGSSYITRSVTVKSISAVSAISGSTTLCQGDNTVLSDAVAGGVWSSDNLALATINSVTGQLATRAAGIDTVVYSVTNASGCVTTATAAVTIHAIPSLGSITGDSALCAESTTLLTDTASGGTWSSSNTGIASVDSAGLVFGVSPGTAVISYTKSNFSGCTSSVTHAIAVHPVPGIVPISGAASLCAGNNTLLTDGSAGGAWSSSNTAIASITAAGSLTGIMAGTVNITYSITTAYGCTARASKLFTVNPIPVAGSITGPSFACIGSSIALADAASGGIWSSSNNAVAVIDSITGILTPLTAPGFVTVTYRVTNVCGSATAVKGITTDPLPVAGSISGGNIVCPGNTVSLTDSVPGGIWTSSNNAIASVDSVSGIVTGAGTGTVTITYAVTTVCGTAIATDSISANPAPLPISGDTVVCAGLTTTFTDPTPGGTWVSADDSIADINTTTGVAGGISAGTVTISYNAGVGCTNFVTTSLTVNALPSVSAITGPSTLCAGTTISLADATASGIWSTVDSAVAAIDSAGTVTGVSAGTTEIKYMVTSSSGCANAANKIITVKAVTALSPIAGPAVLCEGSTSLLTDTTAGGTWSSSDYSVVYIDGTTGAVIAETTGTATVTYSAVNASGCVTTVSWAVTVNSIPVLAATTGIDSACTGSSSTLSNATAGGIWTSSDSSIASVNSFGVVTGISGGTATIRYTVTNASGCSNTASVYFNVRSFPAPAPITGITTFCQGTDVLLIDSVAGGTWTSSNDTLATVDSSGVVIGLYPGKATIFYTLTNSCGTVDTSIQVTVNAIPVVAVITGPSMVCVSSSITLSDMTAGGIWASSDSNATVDSAGLLTGHIVGVDTVIYTVTDSTGCSSSVSFTDTVNALPVVPAISGPTSVCTGTGITLVDTAVGGVWSSSNSRASISTAGVLTGITPGLDTVTYRVTNSAGCTVIVTDTIRVNASPAVAAITGDSSVCAGSAITLANDTTGGVWSSSNATASVSSAGIVTGITAGTDTIAYTFTNSCGLATASLVVTVNPLPVIDTISGVSSVCVGTTVMFTDDSAGGTWAATNANATITSTGMLTGVTPGVDTIVYTIANIFGCSASVSSIIMVDPLPVVAAISGDSAICEGATGLLTDTTMGGLWSSRDTALATVDTLGNIRGRAAGVDSVLYTITNSCGAAVAVFTVTVHPIPAVGPIIGTAIICAGSTVTLTDSATGGVWSSSDSLVATVDSMGTVTTVDSGSVVITYRLINGFGCAAAATYTVSVNTSLPSSAILPAGAATLCGGLPVNLSVSPAVTGISYQWYKNGSLITGATSAAYTTDSAGSFTISLSNGTCSVTLTPTIVSLPPNPVIGFDSAGSVLFTGSFATYQWYYNDTLIPGAVSSILAHDGPGSYMVVVADGSGCTDTSAVYVIPGGSTGVNNVAIVSVRIFPNPATSILQVIAPIKVDVQILSLDGKLIIDRKDAGTIDISQMANGMYLIKVYDKNQVLLKSDKFAKMQ